MSSEVCSCRLDDDEHFTTIISNDSAAIGKAYTKLSDTYGRKFDGSLYSESMSEIKIELNEYAVDHRLIRERLEDSRKKQKEQQQQKELQLRQKQEQTPSRKKKRRDTWER